MLNNKPPLFRSFVLSVPILIGLLTLLTILNSCAPPQPQFTPSDTTSSSTETLTETLPISPTQTTTTVDIFTSVEDSPLQLPDTVLKIFTDKEFELDPMGVAIYAAPLPYPDLGIDQPEPGVIFMLTPIQISSVFPDTPASADQFLEFVKNQPDRQLTIGGLSIARPWGQFSRVGDYTIQFNVEDNIISFVPLAEGEVITSPAIVRSLPLPITQSIAIITSRQLCLTWETVQVCSLIDTPPDPAWIARAEQIQAELALDFEINPDLLVPDIEGRDMHEACAKALSEEQPNYAECRANVLAVPASRPSPPAPDQLVSAKPFFTSSLQVTETAVGILDVTEPISGEAFTDDTFTTPTDIPTGAYTMIELLPENTPLTSPITIPLRLSNLTNSYFLPVTSGFQFIGTAIDGNDPTESDNEAAIFMLGFRGFRLCIFSFQRRICGS